MARRQARWLAFALVCAARGARVEAGEPSPFEGTWDLRVQFMGAQAELAAGRLVLERSRVGTWGGTVFLASKHRVAEVVVEGGAMRLRVDTPAQDLSLEGKPSGDGLSGRMTLSGLEFPWTAVRAPSGPVERFERGTSAGGFLPRAKAEDLGMDAAALDLMVREAATNGTDALLVLRDGRAVVERYFDAGRGTGARPACDVFSVTKFVTAIAVAMLVEDRRIPSFDAPLSTWFPEWAEGTKAKATLRHVMTHTSGVEEMLRTGLSTAVDQAAFVRGRALVTEPGTVSLYNNSAVMLLSAVIAKASGKEEEAFLRERLFAPAGVTSVVWNSDRAGHTLSYGGLEMTGRDLARVGQLVADGGKVGARAVLSPESIAALSTPSSPAALRAKSPGVEDPQGLLWVLLHEWPWPQSKEVSGVYHSGSYGQWLVVYPKSRTVGVRLRRLREGGSGKDVNAAFDYIGFPARLADACR